MSLICLSDYEQKAAQLIAKGPWEFFRSGAGDELSLQLNRDAYDEIRLRPRVLIDVSKRDTSCNVFGLDLDIPIAIAPTSMQKLAHPDGEKATALAAGKMNTIYTMSTLSTTSIEEVAKIAPNTKKWFQLYIHKDRQWTEKLVRRAEAVGYKAIVLTVDSPVFGDRRSVVRNRFQLPEHLSLANFSDETFKNNPGETGINEYVNSQFDDTINWKDVKWLVKSTHLPVILKGILTHEDALLALESECKGIIVSNHGARQLDTVPATIEALPEIVNAVGTKLVVMMDGGIRNGIDVFKAIALGAKLVFIGRPVVYGLTVNGQQGVEDVLGILKKELDTTMGLVGVNRISEINANHVAHRSTYKLSKL